MLFVREYNNEDQSNWDKIVATSINGTFLHSRRFLSYHGSRFKDKSLVVENNQNKIIGVFPAALDPLNLGCVSSHPGLTYGGIIHKGELKGADIQNVLENICRFYKEQELSKLRYKPIPYIYHRIPSSDDLYALFRLNAHLYRRDLAATIDFEYRPALRKSRVHSLKKAIRSEINIEYGKKNLNKFWDILVENLFNKYQNKPTHSIQEISQLSEMFPDNIECVVAKKKSEVIAGAILFFTLPTVHVQYIAANKKGYEYSALDLVFDDCIHKSIKKGYRYFDFGISTENQGRFLNEGLHRFKASFGAGGVVYEHYELNIDLF
ncbi:GNAT family N-acetyltransferase [Ammoniphilus sp. 3BR4]|uniref:GNAT family N-acetyltransferase n=1 Tax=Ammoniphilus sp. 3BR4 TaxID=3158265 RepID=UPI003465785E